MPSSSISSDLARAKVWVRAIEEQYRVRLQTSELREATAFSVSKQHPLTVFAGIGADGQLLLFHPTSEIAQSRSVIDPSLASTPMSGLDAVSQRGAYIRYNSGLWAVHLDEDMPNRVTIKLPKEARDFDLLPSVGAKVVVFGSGQLLEIWKIPEWSTMMKKTHSSLLANGVPSFAD